MQCGEDAVDNNALAALDLVGSDGEAVTDLDPKRTGVARSTDPAIGFYAYVPTVTGTRDQRLDLRLPPEIRLRSFSIMRFRRHATQISISDVRVSQPTGPALSVGKA